MFMQQKRACLSRFELAGQPLHVQASKELHQLPEHGQSVAVLTTLTTVRATGTQEGKNNKDKHPKTRLLLQPANGICLCLAVFILSFHNQMKLQRKPFTRLKGSLARGWERRGPEEERRTREGAASGSGVLH